MDSDETCDATPAFELPNDAPFRAKIKSIRETLTSAVNRTDAPMMLSLVIKLI